jgi:hypothetical protein
VHWQLGHPAAVRGDARIRLRPARSRERPKLDQELARLRERGGGRLVQPPQRSRVGNAPGCELECHRREIRLEDLGRRMRHQVMVLVLGPQPIADPRGDAARTTTTLIGGRLRDADGFEPSHARAWRESRDA